MIRCWGWSDNFYDRYCDRLCSAALKITKDHQLAEDAVQDVFAAICQRPEILLQASTPVAWLLAVVTNRAIDLVRKRDHLAKPLDQETINSLLDRLPFVDEDPQRTAERQELRRVCHECVNLLSRDHQQVIVLTVFNGLQERETAAKLGIATGTVKSRLARARAALKRLILAKDPQGWW